MNINKNMPKQLTKKDKQYLILLSKQFPTIDSAYTEIINLNAILNLPKETEHFISDIHGEDEAFVHVKNNASGELKRKIDSLFDGKLSEQERKELATLVYYPKERLPLILEKLDHDGARKLWFKNTLYHLVMLSRFVASKYTRSKVRKAMPKNFSYVIDELIHEDKDKKHKKNYYNSIVDLIIKINKGEEFILELSQLIKCLVVGRVHVLGDIYDRGPGADIIMENLIDYHSVDFTWGNHDILWMGAASGSKACIANVIRISLRYANLDTLREGYGIDLLPLATFALEHYRGIPGKSFQAKFPDETLTEKELELLAKMHKAIAIIQFKLEHQLIVKRKEFEMSDRLLLDKIDYKKGTITIKGETYPLNDCDFPTINPENPYILTPEENKVINKLVNSFINSERLQKHMRFLFTAGSMILKYNGNLLFHGCIPMTGEGGFREYSFQGEKLTINDFLPIAEQVVREGYYSKNPEDREYGSDFMWYLWCGPGSPLFGKDAMKTFERYYINDKIPHKENKNPYYDFRDDEETVKKILSQFDLDPDTGHIINGHMPVKVKKGESPLKAKGRLINIDGGFSKAYQEETGTAGYTLIFNSREYVLAAHKPFKSQKVAIQEEYDVIPETQIIEPLGKRMFIKHTDIGKEIKMQIQDLDILILGYKTGVIKQKEAK